MNISVAIVIAASAVLGLFTRSLLATFGYPSMAIVVLGVHGHFINGTATHKFVETHVYAFLFAFVLAKAVKWFAVKRI